MTCDEGHEVEIEELREQLSKQRDRADAAEKRLDELVSFIENIPSEARYVLSPRGRLR